MYSGYGIFEDKSLLLRSGTKMRNGSYPDLVLFLADFNCSDLVPVISVGARSRAVELLKSFFPETQTNALVPYRILHCSESVTF